MGTNFFHFVTIHAPDRQTDRQRDGQKGLAPSQYRALHYIQLHGKNEISTQ